MDAYVALATAYNEKARCSMDEMDGAMKELLSNIAAFAESDAEQTQATVHELEFLADVLLVASRKVRADRHPQGSSLHRATSPGSPATRRLPFKQTADVHCHRKDQRT